MQTFVTYAFTADIIPKYTFIPTLLITSQLRENEYTYIPTLAWFEVSRKHI